MSGMFVKTTPYSRLGCDSNAFRAEIAGFINAATGGAPCRATAEDGVWLMKILDAIYTSAKTGKSVDITPIK
jgi:predicted dehydrogenase